MNAGWFILGGRCQGLLIVEETWTRATLCLLICFQSFARFLLNLNSHANSLDWHRWKYQQINWLSWVTVRLLPTPGLTGADVRQSFSSAFISLEVTFWCAVRQMQLERDRHEKRKREPLTMKRRKTFCLNFLHKRVSRSMKQLKCMVLYKACEVLRSRKITLETKERVLNYYVLS